MFSITKIFLLILCNSIGVLGGAALAFVILVIGLLLVSLSDSTRNENYNRSLHPISRASTKLHESSHRCRRLQQLQDDVTEILFLLIELNVRHDILQKIMRHIRRAIFATESTARTAILERLIITIHSLDETECIVQSINNLMITYPVGMLQRENITEEMFDEM